MSLLLNAYNLHVLKYLLLLYWKRKEWCRWVDFRRLTAKVSRKCRS